MPDVSSNVTSPILAPEPPGSSPELPLTLGDSSAPSAEFISSLAGLAAEGAPVAKVEGAPTGVPFVGNSGLDLRIKVGTEAPPLSEPQLPTPNQPKPSGPGPNAAPLTRLAHTFEAMWDSNYPQ
ncbi:hypothetical protein HY419_01050 [candidate division WWE3 bacterium]|nr:hypothetical protein [candidate division WWE3 bacterium]